jgi:hypothetical protein
VVPVVAEVSNVLAVVTEQPATDSLSASLKSLLAVAAAAFALMVLQSSLEEAQPRPNKGSFFVVVGAIAFVL